MVHPANHAMYCPVFKAIDATPDMCGCGADEVDEHDTHTEGDDMTQTDPVITGIRGTITMSDGSTSEFTLNPEGGFQQWGASTERMGRTVDAVEAIAALDLVQEAPDDET